MASVIRYEYSASTEPPEPIESSTLYTGALSYPVGGGFYCAKKWDGGQTVVTRKSFERLWTPANTTTALWLDGNDLTTITKDGSNYVSNWNDKSGDGKNATATGTGKPLWSSGKLSFDGSDDFMVTPSITMGQPVTLFIVASVNTLSGDRTIVNSQYGVDTLKPFQQYINSSGRLFEWRAGSYVDGVQTGTIFQITEQQPTLNRINMWINGNTGTSITRTSYYPDNKELYIGKAQSFGPLGWFSGDIHEICLYIGAITDELIYKFQGYFAWRWDGINGNTALVTTLPSNHSYKLAPPTI